MTQTSRALASFPFAICLCACGAPATYVSATAAPPERRVAVSGSARIDLVPDEACVELTMTARDGAIAASHETLVHNVDALIDVLGEDDALRVERGAIRYSPTYDNNRGGPSRIVGHLATAQINVRLRDFDRIPQVVGLATTRGLERVSVAFYSTQLVEQKAQLRRQALEAARDKARDMAGTLGASLGDIMSIRETSASTSGRIEVANFVAPSPASQLPPTTPPPGSIPMTLSVDIVYALAD